MNPLRSRDLFPLAAALSLSLSAQAQTWESCGSLHTWEGAAAGDQFGAMVRNAGDTDGDGVNDVVIGAFTSAVGGPQSGRGYVYSGQSGALLHDFPGQPNGNFGFAAQPAGDVDADGCADLIFGAPDLSGTTAGAAYVHSGRDGSLLYALQGEVGGDQYGYAVNTVGDVNGDGHADFGVGAVLHASIGPTRGRAYIYSGADGALLYQLDGEGNGDRFGSGVASLGDRNGDGRDDFILGADEGFVGRGRAYVHDGATGVRECTLLPPPTGGVFGRTMLGGTGDLSGDGTPDFFVSDFADAQLRGRVRVYDGADCSLLYQLVGEAAGDTFGTGSGLAGGDVDGDGVDDLLFGALGAGGEGRGQVRLVSGRTGAGIGAFNGALAGTGLGFGAAGMGDLDGDGWPDYVASTPTHAESRGIVHVLSGRPAPPRESCPGAINSTGAAAVLGYARTLGISANELELRVTGAPPGRLGLFLYGAQRSAQPLGDGLLCIAAPQFRASAPLAVGPAGEALLDVDFTSRPFSSGAGAVVAGSAWQFQFWFHDTGGAGSNLSSGLWLTLCP